jgi:uncharacterized membrane protein
MNYRLIQLWLRNIAVAVGIVVGMFAFGFAILFLNTYFGTLMFSRIFAGILMCMWMIFMCYRIAADQLESENRRNNRVMDTLRRD